MKSTIGSAVVAVSGLLAGGVAASSSSSATASSAASVLSASLSPKSESEVVVTQIRSQRTKRLRKHHNGYTSTSSRLTTRRRDLQLFQIVGPAPPPSSTSTTTTTATATPPSSVAGDQSGIFGAGGVTSVSSTRPTSLSPSASPSSSGSSSTTVRQSSVPTSSSSSSLTSTSTSTITTMMSTPLSYSIMYYGDMNDLPYLDYVGCMSLILSSSFSMAISASPSQQDVETDSPTFTPSHVVDSLSLSMGEWEEFMSSVEAMPPIPAPSLSMDWDDIIPLEVESMSIMSIMSILTDTPTSSPPVPAPVPPPATPVLPPLEEKKCEFCSDVGMDESAFIPFSDETTCGMAKEIVVQLNSTSEDCELARKAELICCPKTLAPSISPITMTPAPTISWPPTDAPIATPSSAGSVGSITLTMGVVVSSCLGAFWITAVGLPF